MHCFVFWYVLLSLLFVQHKVQHINIAQHKLDEFFTFSCAALWSIMKFVCNVGWKNYSQFTSCMLFIKTLGKTNNWNNFSFFFAFIIIAFCFRLDFFMFSCCCSLRIYMRNIIFLYILFLSLTHSVNGSLYNKNNWILRYSLINFQNISFFFGRLN